MTKNLASKVNSSERLSFEEFTAQYLLESNKKKKIDQSRASKPGRPKNSLSVVPQQIVESYKEAHNFMKKLELPFLNKASSPSGPAPSILGSLNHNKRQIKPY
jgi:hypothetical protein